MIGTMLGGLVVVFVVLYVLDCLGELDIFDVFVDIFRLLFNGLRRVVATVARILRKQTS